MLRSLSRFNLPTIRHSGQNGAPPVPSRSNWRQGPVWGVVMGWLAASLTLLVTANHPLGARLQYDTLDFWFRLRDPALPRAAAILAVDDATVQRWRGRDFDATDTARLLRLLKRNGVRAVALAFPDIGTHPLSDADREVLASALRETGIGHLPARFRDPNSPRLMRGGNVKPFSVG